VKSKIIALLSIIVSATVAAAAQDETPYHQAVDLVYADVHGTGLLMDVFTPTCDKNGLALVDVASGAWFSDRGKIRDHKRAKIYDVFCARGYTVFAIRPGSRTKYDAGEMLDHVRRGIRYVKTRADKYGIDPQRLGLIGASAGGHLASLAAVTAEEGKPEAKDPLERQDTGVKAVAVFFPVTDFMDWDGKKPDFARFGALLFSGGIEGHSDEDIEEQAKKISPLHQVSAGVPPFLLIHGDADLSVPLQQSERMVEALKAVGGSAELIVKPGGGHPWPTIYEEVAVMADWFDKQL
jgi:acetyl esterase/lipase